MKKRFLAFLALILTLALLTCSCNSTPVTTASSLVEETLVIEAPSEIPSSSEEVISSDMPSSFEEIVSSSETISSQAISSSEAASSKKATNTVTVDNDYGTLEDDIQEFSDDDDNQSITVYITDTGEKYHRSGCRYLKKSKYAISLSDAKAQGYDPCSVCDPPY